MRRDLPQDVNRHLPDLRVEVAVGDVLLDAPDPPLRIVRAPARRLIVPQVDQVPQQVGVGLA